MRVMIRCLLMAAAILMTAVCAGEELLCVNGRDFSALLTPDGREVIAPGLYDDVFCVVPGELYAAGFALGGEMLYDLCDAEGNVISGQPRHMFDASGDAVVFRQDTIYGAVGKDGSELIPHVYTQLVGNGAGDFYGFTTDPNDDHPDEILLIDASGVVRSTGVYTGEGLSEPSDGRMVFRSPDTEKYGYLDTHGNIAVEAALDYAGAFQNGMARASREGLFGVLSPSGEWLVSPKYRYIEIGDKVILGVQGEDTCVVWDAATCTELFRTEGARLEASLVGERILVNDGISVRVYETSGELLLEADASAAVAAGAGTQLVLADGDWGSACVSIVNGDGSVSQRQDQHLLVLDDMRYAFMTMDVAAYSSQALGEIRYSCDYDSIRYGMLDLNGNEILPAEYLEITGLGVGRYLTAAMDGYRVVDEDGAVIWSHLDPAMR